MRLIYCAGAAALSLLPGFGAAAAADVPRFNPAQYCQSVAAMEESGSNSQALYNDCLETEQGAYDGLKKIWDSVPAETQAYCLEIAQAGGNGDYAILQDCVNMENGAARIQPKSGF